MRTLEIVVAVGENHRRVLRIHVAEEVGNVFFHNLCFGLSQPSAQTHSSERAHSDYDADFFQWGVVDAESLEGGAEGEDNKLGNGRRVTFNKDIADWDGCDADSISP